MAKKFPIIKMTKITFASFLLIFFISTKTSFALSIGEEQQLGERLLFQLRQKIPILEEPDIANYINTLGNEVLTAADAHYFDYHFFIIDSQKFNAFAVPSGLIFFYSGLIDKINHENELVAVMAHEVGHVVKRHIAQTINQQKLTGVATLAAAILGAGIGGKEGSALMSSAIAANQSVALHYSREHEEEADLLAYDWMRKMKRGIDGEIRMLQTMRRIARYRSDKLPAYLLSHPNPEERLWTIQSFADNDTKNGLQQNIRVIDNFNFLRFKYRILTRTHELHELRPLLTSLITHAKENNEQKLMAQYGLALLAKEEKNYSQALQLLEEVLAAYPEKSILFTDKGIIEMEAGMLNRAMQSLKTAIQKDNSDLYALFALGKLLKRQQKFADADEYFARVSTAMPSYPDVWFQRGALEASRKNTGLSRFYLAQSELYQGEIKRAKQRFLEVEKDTALSAEIIRKAQEQLALIGRLEKKH